MGILESVCTAYGTKCAKDVATQITTNILCTVVEVFPFAKSGMTIAYFARGQSGTDMTQTLDTGAARLTE